MASTFLGPQYIPVYCTSLPATSLPCSWPKIACRTLEAKARFLFVTMVGYIMHFCLFHYVTGLSVVGAIFCNITVRTSTSTFLNTLVYLCAMSKSVPRDCTRWHHQRLVFPVISYLISPLVNQ